MLLLTTNDCQRKSTPPLFLAMYFFCGIISVDPEGDWSSWLKLTATPQHQSNNFVSRSLIVLEDIEGGSIRQLKLI